MNNPAPLPAVSSAQYVVVIIVGADRPPHRVIDRPGVADQNLKPVVPRGFIILLNGVIQATGLVRTIGSVP